MNIQPMIRSALLLAGIFFNVLYVCAAGLLPDRNCAVCGRVITDGEKAWLFPARYETLKNAVKNGEFRPSMVSSKTNGDLVVVSLRVCEKCHKIPDRCSLCYWPITGTGKDFRTSDGRWICERDVPFVVLDEDTARELFQSARDTAVDVIGNFFALKNPTVNVHVTDVFDRTVGADGMHTMAVSKSTDAGSEIVHYVSIYTGRPKQEAFYSCVHEYTHLWINENVHNHDIEKYTREGLCELVAYKVAEARGDAVMQNRILTNSYTRGTIADLVQYASQEDMNAILNWVPNGTTRTLAEGVATATAAKAKPPEIPLDVQVAEAQQARAQAQPKKETLGLNGIIRTPKGMIVLLNGGLILGKGESGLVKLNGTQARVRCIDVHPDSVVLQLEGATNAVTLKLSH